VRREAGEACREAAGESREAEDRYRYWVAVGRSGVEACRGAAGERREGGDRHAYWVAARRGAVEARRSRSVSSRRSRLERLTRRDIGARVKTASRKTCPRRPNRAQVGYQHEPPLEVVHT
jgi:hypothetical protein